MSKSLKTKGLYEPTGGEILMSAAISIVLTGAVVVAGLVLLIMGLWYLAWVPIPVGLLVGFLINVIFRGKSDDQVHEQSDVSLGDSYQGGQWSKEA